MGTSGSFGVYRRLHNAMHSVESGHGTSQSVCRDWFCPETWKKKSEKNVVPSDDAWSTSMSCEYVR